MPVLPHHRYPSDCLEHRSCGYILAQRRPGTFPRDNVSEHSPVEGKVRQQQQLYPIAAIWTDVRADPVAREPLQQRRNPFAAMQGSTEEQIRMRLLDWLFRGIRQD